MDLDQQQAVYYQERQSKYGVSPEGVGWKNQQAQEIRFIQLLKIFEKSSGFSVNDLGCGFGHLCTYLQKRGYEDFTYRGYDLSKKMIDQARQLHEENGRARFKLIADATEMETADYTLASGIFSLRKKNSEAVWLSYILNTLEAMKNKSRLGFAFNMLTKYSDQEYMEAELYYADPCFIFDFCKRNFSRNVALLHDYQEYDFTILVRKNI